MSIAPLDRHHVIAMDDEPLPECWLRRGPTEPDRRERADAGLLRVGEEGLFHEALVEAIDEANEVVLIASFLLADKQLADAMLRAAERKVRVYALTASENRVTAAVRDDDLFGVRMATEHKQLLDRLAGRVLVRTAEHLHAKFLVTDHTTSARGYLSTANFNLALQKSVELGVKLSPEEAHVLAGWFSWAFWAESDHELTEKKGRLRKVSAPPAQPAQPPNGNIVVTTQQHTTLKSATLDLIAATERELLISTYGMELPYPVTRAVLEKLEAGVEVTIMTRPRPAILPAMSALVSAGARVLAHDKLHAKAIVSDAGAMVMTANLESHGLERGFEVGVRLAGARARALRETLVEWSEGFPWQLAIHARRGDHLGEICLAKQGLRDGCREVTAEQRVPLQPVTADDALSLESASRPEMRIPQAENYPQRVRFEWQVLPPKLPKKSKQLMREEEPMKTDQEDKNGKKRKKRKRVPYDPPAYQRGDQRYVLVRSQADIEPARILAAQLSAKVVVE